MVPGTNFSSILLAMNFFIARHLWNLWPPYLGAGIRITHIAKDWTSIDVQMKLRPWNRNIVATHFGGSLYSMTDPFFMAILMHNLGPDYIVWDKAAKVRFRRPGRGRVTVHFAIPKDEIEAIRARADVELKVEPTFVCQVVDEGGGIVAEVEKLLYVRRKDRQLAKEAKGSSA